jgi:hypothetical protein
MGQDDVLFVADAQFVVAVVFGKVGKDAHLRRRGIAGRGAVGLEGHADDGVAVGLVRGEVGVGPGAEDRVGGPGGLVGLRVGGAKPGRGEVGADARQNLLIHAGEHRAAAGKFVIGQRADAVDPVFMNRDLDPGLVLVVPAAEQVVDRDDGLEIGQEVGLGQEVADHLAQHRGPAEAAADKYAEPGFAAPRHDLQADVMGADHGAIGLGPGHGDLELAAKELELGVVGGPLADELGVRPGIGHLVRRRAREMVGGHVADRVAAGLDRVQPDLGQCVQHVGHVAEPGPVELDVLAGGEVAVTLVPALGDHRELPHLCSVQRAIGDRDAQHVGVKLQVEAVHQAERLELLLGQRAGEAAFDLRAELGVARGEKGRVEVGVVIHRSGPPVFRGRNWRGRGRGSPPGGGAARVRPGRAGCP